MNLLFAIAVILSQTTAFVRQNSQRRRPGWVATSGFAQESSPEPLVFPNELGLEVPVASNLKSIEEVEAKYGMPWTSSIDSTAFVDEELLYMPFWNWHMDFMKENLTDLKVESCSNGKTDFSYNENTDKKARITSMCLTSAEYRKIRLTYYDAGENTQVYNAVFYPDPSYDLPVLGIDLLAFNRKKYLAIVDFQPMHEHESDHDAEFSHLLAPIKDSFKNLSGRMSSKFYDETKFFSQQMLFSRFEDDIIISNELYPAFQQYVQAHLDLIRSCEGTADRTAVLARQQDYDTYSAERDPATGLFTAMFGAEWANDFVHDFLFSMSERKEHSVENEKSSSAHSSVSSARKPSRNPFAAATSNGRVPAMARA